MKQFTCKKCGCHRLEEVLPGVTQTSEIKEIELFEDGSLGMDYGNTLTEGGDMDDVRYQCLECGESVTTEELEAIAEPV